MPRQRFELVAPLSTPSATTRRSSRCPRSTVARTIAAPLPVIISSTKLRSTFSSWTATLLSSVRDE